MLIVLLLLLGKFMDIVQIAVGQEYEVTVEKLVYGGDGLARFSGITIFIPNSTPGDFLKVRIVLAEKKFFRAEIVEILKPSPNRQTPPCKYFNECGGCQLQHITYATQLEIKADFIQDSLKRIGRFNSLPQVQVKHDAEFNYRNRAQIKIDRSSSPFQIGFYKAGSHEVCDIENCLILSPELNKSLGTLRNSQKAIALSKIPYSKIDLVTGNKSTPNINLRDKIASEAVCQNVLGIDYYFDPDCFFQVNQPLLPTLVETVVGEHKGKLALDLYAGVGLFALQLSRNYQKVVATEVNKQAVHWAEHNIQANKIKNLDFHSLSTEKWLAKFARKIGEVDLIVLDPPRAGIIQKTLQNILAIQPKEITYVSCEPTTLARDLRILVDGGYGLESVTGIDLFPQTYHIETVAKLKKIST